MKGVPVAQTIAHSNGQNRGRLVFFMTVPPFNHIYRCSIVLINPCRPQAPTLAMHTPIGTPVGSIEGDADVESSVSKKTHRVQCRDIARLPP
jgi:hypothetical protein